MKYQVITNEWEVHVITYEVEAETVDEAIDLALTGEANIISNSYDYTDNVDVLEVSQNED